MTAAQTTNAGGAGRRLAPGQTPVAGSAADLTEAMMAVYGHRVPLEVIARLVHDVLDSAAHPRGAPVPQALGRQVVRRLRELSHTTDPGLRPARAQAIARALHGRRS